MAKYRAAVDFADLMDGRHLYRAGDEFPRPGLTVSDERLIELSGSDNRAGRPLIAAEPDEEPEKPENKPAKRQARRK